MINPKTLGAEFIGTSGWCWAPIVVALPEAGVHRAIGGNTDPGR